MFESAEIGHRIDKKTYEERLPALREALVEAQYELKEKAAFPVIILITGIEGAGKGETVKLLNEWLDPRLIQVEAMLRPTDEEVARPPAWRHWRRLPGKGRTGVFFGGWYDQILFERLKGNYQADDLALAISRTQRFERMLSDEGALLLKFWFHLSRGEMKKRLKTLKNDPQQSWRLTPLDWQQSKFYKHVVRHGEQVLRATNREFAPWHIIEGSDERYRALTFGQLLLDSLRTRLDQPDIEHRAHAAPPIPSLDGRSLLSSLVLDQEMDKKIYQEELAEQQGRLARLMRDGRKAGHALVAVFEGNDAAGKGGAIRRVTGALDPRQYRTVSIGAPDDEELAQPYLWRFWRSVPARGCFTIFDRSWYGRVLVERVEELCATSDWLRAYGEINDFEEQLNASGTVLVKFWLAIDKDTQLARFREREQKPFKRYKITPDDWRNREKWDAYAAAVNDMVDRTSTALAPWTLVEANNKRFARIKVLRTLGDALEKALEGQGKR